MIGDSKTACEGLSLDFSKPFCCYETLDLSNGMRYRGKGRTSAVLSGRYKGSGILLGAAIREKGWDNFKSEVVATFDTEDEAYEFESKYVQVDPNQFYNRIYGGLGNTAGKVLIHSGSVEHMVLPEWVDYYQQQGYELGRTQEHELKVNGPEMARIRTENRVKRYGSTRGRLSDPEVAEKAKRTRIERYGNAFGPKLSEESRKQAIENSLKYHIPKYGHIMGRAIEPEFHEKSAETNKKTTGLRNQVADLLGIGPWEVKRTLRDLGYRGKVGEMCEKYLKDSQ